MDTVPSELDVAWDALVSDLFMPDASIILTVDRHRPAIEAEARAAALDVEALADKWERSADVIGARASVGDPAATLATVNTLRSCATSLRAILAERQP